MRRIDEDKNVLSKWISVKERLPEKDGYTIICTADGTVLGASYEHDREGSKWTDDCEEYIDYDVTHWMPLPEPPEEVSVDD